MSASSLIVERSIDIAAEPATVWNIIASPACWPHWMMVPPAIEPRLDALHLGSEVHWRNQRGEVYLTGIVTALDPESCLVLELKDVSWQRRAAPGEVTYRMAIVHDGARTRVEFRLGDLSIDPNGEEWYGSYVNSRELETIKELAEADASSSVVIEPATPAIVGRDEWQRARAELLVSEKAHTRAGDELAASRRRLPMTRMEPLMVEGPDGPVRLRDAFEGRRMLIVYHFMWNTGAPHHKQCEGCTHSQAAMNSAVRAYLAERGVSYAVFSSGPWPELAAYREFMGWTASWYSTAESGGVLATRNGGDVRCYLRVSDEVFQTYETKWRGIEAMLPTLQLLDLTAYGRQETWENSPAGWPQHDEAGSWWRRDGRPVAQWTRTDVPVK